MIRKLIAIILVFTVFFVSIPDRKPIPQARANPALAAPAAAVGALELCLLVIAAALLMHIISQQQHDDYSNQIHGLIDRIWSATGDALRAALNQSVTLMTGILAITHAPCLSAAIARVAVARATDRENESAGTVLLRTDGGTERRADPAARARAAECQGNMMDCCGDFFSRFNGRMQKSGDSVKIFRDGRMRDLLCCFNWDRTHHGLEIFNDRGVHRGERGCDDFNEDPCAYTSSRGAHGLPDPSRHQARGLCAH